MGYDAVANPNFQVVAVCTTSTDLKQVGVNGRIIGKNKVLQVKAVLLTEDVLPEEHSPTE